MSLSKTTGVAGWGTDQGLVLLFWLHGRPIPAPSLDCAIYRAQACSRNPKGIYESVYLFSWNVHAYHQDFYLEKAKIKWNALFWTKAIEYGVKLSTVDPGILEHQIIRK